MWRKKREKKRKRDNDEGEECVQHVWREKREKERREYVHVEKEERER